MPLQIHLFDIDIPGKITFLESKTLTAGEVPTIVDTGLTCSFTSHLFRIILFLFIRISMPSFRGEINIHSTELMLIFLDSWRWENGNGSDTNSFGLSSRSPT